MMNENEQKERLPLELVQHMAALSRLRLTDGEIEKFSFQFVDILGYMNVLEKVETEGVEPLYSCATDAGSPREDKACNSRSHEEILANAPETDGEYFLVPRII